MREASPVNKEPAGAAGRIGVVAGAAALGLAMTLWSAAPAWCQNVSSDESVQEQQLQAQSVQKHHYASPAERAEDDLLIVKVKAAIADSDLADNYPMTIDADHGRVTLTGVLGSREDVAQTLALVQGIDGVTGINNRLTWVKRPQ
jgi:osmotically-inducible protein OsmY